MSAMPMAQLGIAEQLLKVLEAPALNRQSKKKRRMSDGSEMISVRGAISGRTARERAINSEKERLKKRAEKEEKRRERERIQDEEEAKAQAAENEKAESAEILKWMRKIPPCPVFTPTEEEFADPLKYIESLADEVAPKFGICKVIPPYVPLAFSGRKKFRDPDFLMEVRKQPLRMVAWKDKENEPKGVSFNKDTRMWTVRQLEEFANEFVHKNYEGSSSQLQLPFIELEFWKEFLLRQNKHVRYASDVPGTAFDAFEDLAKSDWNLGKLPMLRDSVLRIVESGIPGVTEPMLYVGMLFSMFAWHTEDQYLYSINYHHLGAPKTWYGVPGNAAQAFEAVAAEKVFSLGLDPHGLAHTLRLLIGKTIMFPPGLLVDAGVPVCRAVQMPGEYVITFPRSYHAGFSNGFNTGEAVNFAMPDWFAYGAACTRRYRLLRQIQVVAYDELLCKEAQQVHAQMVEQRTKGTPLELRGMEQHTVVEFVRLMRWQHRQRWKLHQWGALPRPLEAWRRKSSECALCHHKNYLAYVLCDCQEGPICLNHPVELAACRCQMKPGPAGQVDVGRVVNYAHELPLLERMAAGLERHPGIEEKVAQAARDEQMDDALRDEWKLCERSEAVIGDGGPTDVIEDGIDMIEYQRWAPIPGYGYDELLVMRALQPGTPSQQLGDASPDPPLLLTAAVGCEESGMGMQTDSPPLPFSPPPPAPSLQAQPATPHLVTPTNCFSATTPGVPQHQPPPVVGTAEEAPSKGGQRKRKLVRVKSGTSGSGGGQEVATRGRKRKAFEGLSGDGVEDGGAALAAQAVAGGERAVAGEAMKATQRGRKKGGCVKRSVQQKPDTRRVSVSEECEAMEVEGEAGQVAAGVAAMPEAQEGVPGAEAQSNCVDVAEGRTSGDGTSQADDGPSQAEVGPVVGAAVDVEDGKAASCSRGEPVLDDGQVAGEDSAVGAAQCSQAMDGLDAGDWRSDFDDTGFGAIEANARQGGGPESGVSQHALQARQAAMEQGSHEIAPELGALPAPPCEPFLFRRYGEDPGSTAQVS